MLDVFLLLVKHNWLMGVMFWVGVPIFIGIIIKIDRDVVDPFIDKLVRRLFH